MKRKRRGRSAVGRSAGGMLAAMLLLLGTLCSDALGARRIEEFNVDLFFGWAGCYRPMEWTPVEVTIDTELTEPFEGLLTLSANQDGLNRLHVRHAFVVTPDAPVHLPLVSKFAFAADQCHAEIRDTTGRVRWTNTFDLWDPSLQVRMLRAVQENDLLVGTIGERKFGLLQLPQQTVCVSDRQRGKVYVGSKLVRSAPWDWTGYAALDALVLYDPDWSRFSPDQLQAVIDYVENGGMLLVVLGMVEPDLNGPVGRLLPFEIDASRQVTLDPETLGELGLSTGAEESVVCRPLRARDNGMGLSLIRTRQGQTIAGAAYVGFGRVAVVGFDPAALSDRHRQHATSFWVGRLRDLLEEPSRRRFEPYSKAEDLGPLGSRFVRRQVSMLLDGQNSMDDIPLRRSLLQVTEEQTEDAQGNWQNFTIGYARSGSNAIMEHLYNITEMKPLSIWWVILLLTLLAILLGPIDYIVLKRKGLLPLTWVTSVGWILLFSVGAYYGVEALRGGNCQFRMVTVTDLIEGVDVGWRTEYAGIFAPRSDDYAFENPRPTEDARPWWSGVAPTEESLYWYRQQPGSRNVVCVQHDGSNIPISVPISIWTIQTLMSERPVVNREFEAAVRREGDSYTLTITNLSDRPIDGGYVLVGANRRVDFGEVPPRAERTFSSQPRTFEGWAQIIQRQQRQLRDGRGGLDALEHEVAYAAVGVLPRTQTMCDYLAQGAVIVCAHRHSSSVPYRLEQRTYQADSLELIRQIVFPADGETGS